MDEHDEMYNESGMNEELECAWDILTKCQPHLDEDEFNFLKRLAGLSDDNS